MRFIINGDAFARREAKNGVITLTGVDCSPNSGQRNKSPVVDK